MSCISIFNAKSVALAASLAVAMPLTSFAGSAWSVGTVNQSQFAFSKPHHSDLSQKASIWTSTKLDNQASAESKTTASQSGQFVHGTQTQKLGASSHLEWENNKWPANAKATTDGFVKQNQVDWTRKTNLQQDAQLWQKSKVGDTVSQLDVQASNDLKKGGAGDYRQSQKLNGNTGATGFVSPKVPCGGSCHNPCNINCNNGWFGGRLVQDVQVFVRNFFEF